MNDERVSVATVSNEVEAEVVCGLLRANGIECGHRVTEAIDSPLEEFTADGPREILVQPSDAATARELLANVPPQSPD
jgi:hypothetical protein